MKKLFVLPALLFAACGDNLAPDAEQATGGAETVAEESPRPIDASIYIYNPSCIASVAAFEADVYYADDRSPVGAVECRWTFDDGSTSDVCVGEHEFATPGFHDFTLDVKHTLTGETAHVAQNRYIYPALTADLEVTAPECGLELSYKGSVSIPAETLVFVQEQDKVIDADPSKLEATVGVTEAGTYTVVITAEDERTNGPICSARVEKQVTVTACHEHTPGCGH
jgi:hypothetical protein